LNGNGCPECSGNLPLTKKIVNERIKDRGIKLIGKFITTKVPVLFRCANNHKWKASPSTVLSGHGCPICAGTLPLTKKIVNERIKDRGIELIDDYINSGKRSLFRCANNHTWETRPRDVMRGRGCPSCCEGGGFKPDKAAHGYLLDFGYFIKFGISNVLKNRLQAHKRCNGKFMVIKTKLFENGQDALDWENDIKKKYGGWYVAKDILPHGYTETLPMCFKETLITMLDN
jgi:hypothetical protein